MTYTEAFDDVLSRAKIWVKAMLERKGAFFIAIPKKKASPTAPPPPNDPAAFVDQLPPFSLIELADSLSKFPGVEPNPWTDQVVDITFNAIIDTESRVREKGKISSEEILAKCATMESGGESVAAPVILVKPWTKPATVVELMVKDDVVVVRSEIVAKNPGPRIGVIHPLRQVKIMDILKIADFVGLL